MTKKELRKLFLEKRKALDEGEFTRLNLALYSVFFSSIDLSFVRVLHLYLPIEGNREPDTRPILDRVRREFPAVRISLPRVGSGRMLENFYYDGPHQLKVSAWGIPEPVQGHPTNPSDIDMVIVPLLAIDRAGHRVGYGRGYYDRLLATTRPDCRKVGISFFEPVASIQDVDDDDVALDQCVTPAETLVFPLT